MATSKSPRAKQFPATAGNAAAEVDQRSADGSDGTRHVKEFVVLGRDYSEAADSYDHAPNMAAVTGEAIQRGLHPRGGVRFDGTTGHPDGQSLTLAYSVETVPSSIDRRPQDTTTPRKIVADGAEN